MLKKDYKADLAKTARGTYIIKVSEFYGTDFVGPEQIEVTEEVLDYLISQKRIEKKKEVDDYRNTAAFGFDDVEAAEMLGIFEHKAYDKHNFKIHDYFAAKSVDKVKPGGVVALVTSKFTMDKLNEKARRYLAERCDLLGAVRLPNTAFKQNAGTEVTTDILFLKKRETMTVEVPAWVHMSETADGIPCNTAFNLFYPKDSKDVPTKVAQFYEELQKDADEMLHPDERNYYNIPAVFGNNTAMESLSEYVIDGKIGSYENGLTMVFYERDGISLYPYSIGDKVNSIALDGSLAHQGHDMELIIEAIAVIPEAAKETSPIIYSAFDFGKGLAFAAPQEATVFLNTYKEKYDRVYISIDESADINAITQQIQKLLDSSMKVKLQTITECDEAYRSSYIARFASVIVLFAILVLMAVIGYHSMISMRLQISRPKIAVLRAIGLSERRWNRTFLFQNILNTIISCVIGTVLVYITSTLINTKYNQALESFGYPDSDLFGASAEVYKQVNDLNSIYLFEYEIHNAPVILPLIIVSLTLVILSAAIASILLRRNKNESIISQMNDHTKE